MRTTTERRSARALATRPPAAAGLLAVLVLTSCTAESPTTAWGEAQPWTVASGAEGLTPLDDAPGAPRTLEGAVVRLWAPEGFRRTVEASPDGDGEMLVLSAPGSAGEAVAEVGAFDNATPSPDPEADIEQEIQEVVFPLEDLRGAEDVSTADLDWPGADAAMAVSWLQDSETPEGGTVRERRLLLGLSADDGRSATVLVAAPEDSVESSGVAEVLRTARLADA